MPRRRLSKTPEAYRMRKRRRVLRLRIIKLLGGKCGRCGTDKGRLEPHHTEERTWKSMDVWSTTRLGLYIKEIEDGVLKQLRCRKCNNMDGKPSEFGAADLPDDF